MSASAGGGWEYRFHLPFCVRTMVEHTVAVVREPEGWGSLGGFGGSHGEGARTPLPKGFAALVDAEGELVAFVPDSRRLPEHIAALLDAADDGCSQMVDDEPAPKFCACEDGIRRAGMVVQGIDPRHAFWHDVWKACCVRGVPR